MAEIKRRPGGMARKQRQEACGVGPCVSGFRMDPHESRFRPLSVSSDDWKRRNGNAINWRNPETRA